MATTIPTPDAAELRRCWRSGPLLPPCSSTTWLQVQAKPLIQAWRGEVQVAAAQAAAAAIPELTAELYARFHRDGDRLAFETAYFERRRQLGVLAVAELLLPPDERRRDELWRRWDAVLGETSWALPAHVPDPSGSDARIIDLFAAESVNLMGELIDLFGSIAPPDLVQRARTRVEHSVELYLGPDGESRWGWFRCHNNWNAVCNQGIAGAALACLGPDRLAEVLARVGRNLPLFLAGFTSDGGCSEGPGYWGYGFGRFARLNEQLEARTQGQWTLFADLEHVRRIARFGPAMTLPAERVVNFSDAPTHGNLDPSLLAYLAERLADPGLDAHAQAAFRIVATPPREDRPRSRFDYGRPGGHGPDLYGSRADVYHLVRYALRCPDELPADVPPPNEPTWLPDLGVWVVRGRDATGTAWAVAAKGGHNGEHHNHNDGGSFLVHHAGQHPIAEIGLPEYMREYFRPETRYTFLAARSLGHSVPRLAGHEQAPGAEHAARVLRAEFGAAGGGQFEVELAGCYPAAAGVESCRRTIEVEAEPLSILVTDRVVFSAPAEAESAFISLGTVDWPPGSDCARIIHGTHCAWLLPGPDCRIERVETHPYVSRLGRPAHAHRIVVVSRAGPAVTVELSAALAFRPPL